MKKFIAFVALVGAFAGGAQAAPAKGDWVLAKWQGGQYWFPGIVESVGGSGIGVKYDDGTRETRPVSQIRPYTWRAGSKIECDFKHKGDYYAARIVTADPGGIDLVVLYEDGVKETTRTGRCRSL